MALRERPRLAINRLGLGVFPIGLKGVRLFTSDKCLGLIEALGEFYPEAAWQR